MPAVKKPKSAVARVKKQMGTDLVLSRAPFSRFVHATVTRFGGPAVIQSVAVVGLQRAAEAVVAQLFGEADNIARSSKRATVLKEDIYGASDMLHIRLGAHGSVRIAPAVQFRRLAKHVSSLRVSKAAVDVVHDLVAGYLEVILHRAVAIAGQRKHKSLHSSDIRDAISPPGVNRVSAAAHVALKKKVHKRKRKAAGEPKRKRKRKAKAGKGMSARRVNKLIHEAVGVVVSKQ